MVVARNTDLSQMRKGIVEFCVLARLRHGDAYGRELASDLGTSSAILTSEGTLYPLLARLRKRGWVETTWQPSDSGPPRRYYTLTGEGSAALDAFAAAWTPFSRAVTEILEDAR